VCKSGTPALPFHAQYFSNAYALIVLVQSYIGGFGIRDVVLVMYGCCLVW